MSYKKFELSDLFFNTIKTKPHYKFKFYNGKTFINNSAESNIYLYQLNEELIPPFVCLLTNAYDFSCPENSQYISTI